MKKDNQQIEEEELIKKYLDGDNRAFGPLYYRYRGLFFHFIHKQHPKLPMDDKEDLAIEFLGSMSSRLHMYDKEKSLFRTWMTNCITNFLHQYRSRKWVEKNKITSSISKKNEEGDSWEDSIVSDENPLHSVSYRNIIRLIKKKLEGEDWRIFELHFLQGYTQLETGEKLGLREDTMWYRIKKIRKKLDGIQNL
jgi:RNA polymerase sigma factor (sigma-70 family)